MTQVQDERGGRWRAVLLALVFVSLANAPWSWIDDGFTPSWIVYPTFLLVGLWRLRGGGIVGTVFVGVTALVFLLVHLPWTWAAVTDAGSNPLDASGPYNPGQWLVTLFLVPLLTAAAAFMVRREALH